MKLFLTFLCFSCLAAEITWQKIPNAIEYDIEYGTRNVSVFSTTSKTNFVVDLLPNKEYFVKVRSVNRHFKSDFNILYINTKTNIDLIRLEKPTIKIK